MRHPYDIDCEITSRGRDQREHADGEGDGEADAESLGHGGRGTGEVAAAAAAWLIPPRNPGSRAVIACCRTTATSAEPSAPADRWTTLMALVAWPMAAGGRSWNAAAMAGVIVVPRPAPIRNTAAISDQ